MYVSKHFCSSPHITQPPLPRHAPWPSALSWASSGPGPAPNNFHELTGVDLVLTDLSTRFYCADWEWSDLFSSLINGAATKAQLLRLTCSQLSFSAYIPSLGTGELSLGAGPDALLLKKPTCPLTVWFPGPTFTSPQSQFLFHKSLMPEKFSGHPVLFMVKNLSPLDNPSMNPITASPMRLICPHGDGVPVKLRETWHRPEHAYLTSQHTGSFSPHTTTLSEIARRFKSVDTHLVMILIMALIKLRKSLRDSGAITVIDSLFPRSN